MRAPAECPEMLLDTRAGLFRSWLSTVDGVGKMGWQRAGTASSAMLESSRGARRNAYVDVVGVGRPPRTPVVAKIGGRPPGPELNL